MKSLPLITMTGMLFLTACTATDDQKKSPTIKENMEQIEATTAVQGKEGHGNIQLECNGKTYEIVGVCGSVSTMGTITIAVRDDKNPAKVFTIDFATDKLPEKNSSFTIVPSVYEDKDASHVAVGFNDMNQEKTMIWEGDNKTGKLDFEVNGAEIKCSFSNLKLQPAKMYNKGDVDGIATISGSIMVYKN